MCGNDTVQACTSKPVRDFYLLMTAWITVPDLGLITVFIRIDARASIFYKWFLTQGLNESGVYLNPGVNFLLFTCPG